jgi:hypothetical protein
VLFGIVCWKTPNTQKISIVQEVAADRRNLHLAQENPLLGAGEAQAPELVLPRKPAQLMSFRVSIEPQQGQEIFFSLSLKTSRSKF